jgi:hypothetical protein
VHNPPRRAARTRGPGVKPVIAAAAELLARFGDPERTCLEHVPDEDRRCRACTTPGYGTPHAPWPCLLHIIATDAATK